MKLLIAMVAIILVSGCANTADYFSGQTNEVAKCFKADGGTTFLGQSTADVSGCFCTISPQAGLRVTAAEISADGECYMTLAVMPGNQTPGEISEENTRSN